ncbi:SDR family NAD(P)-dependent oxidoreductase [Oceanicoccus sagamiensis]|uniref:Ketoreductase domain-containing protein n=1 Tax=Oceanicoccus sagamiensis TaxID=716816 RepID=A0A1X9NAX2_9GAMM|nr:SDR family oxidoreductase [Oceanicoccus sagamiensis]ARN75188.1 hypothetical protein BST96_14325 [Oceanicoccus sagamiensis]
MSSQNKTKNGLFDQRVAAITGAGSGIGQQLALQLATEGCHLALADISQDGLNTTLEQLKGLDVRITTHTVDVADQAQIEQFAATVASEHGGVNFLFNNAGVALGGRIDSVSDEDMHWLMNINYWGVVYGCRAFLPLLKQQQVAHIVNVSSVFGLFTAPYNGIYSASKFAVNGFTDALAQELRKSPVNVSCAFPAGIKTAIAKSARMIADTDANRSEKDLQRTIEKMFWTTAAEAATEIIDGVNRNKQRILVGKGAFWMDLARRILPVNYTRLFKL